MQSLFLYFYETVKLITTYLNLEVLQKKKTIVPLTEIEPASFIFHQGNHFFEPRGAAASLAMENSQSDRAL